MASSTTSRALLATAVAAGCIAVAVAVALRSCRGPATPFEPTEVPASVVGAIDAMTRQLVALDADARRARIRELLSPDAPDGAADALAAQLDALARAERWTLAAADGYGGEVVKALYDVTHGGRTRRIALLFERRDGAVLLLDVAR